MNSNEDDNTTKTTIFKVGEYQLKITHRNILDEYEIDPNFFEPGYTLAASTGYLRVWEGSEILTSFMACNYEMQKLIRNRRVIELGSGSGLLGLAAAALGGHVLLTDLTFLVEDVLRRNIKQNENVSRNDELNQQLEANEISTKNGTEDCCAWPGSLCVGDGSAATQALDWTKSIDVQAPSDDKMLYHCDPRRAEIIIAAECVWLRDLVLPFVNTVIELMHGQYQPKCILSFRDRSDDSLEDGAFAGVKEVVKAFEERGCIQRTIHQVPTEDEGKMCIVYEITLAFG